MTPLLLEPEHPGQGALRGCGSGRRLGDPQAVRPDSDGSWGCVRCPASACPLGVPQPRTLSLASLPSPGPWPDLQPLVGTEPLGTARLLAAAS